MPLGSPNANGDGLGDLLSPSIDPLWTRICGDLITEGAALRAFVDGVTADGMEVTPFHGWRVRDVVAHLTVLDRLALLTIVEPMNFELERTAFIEGTREMEGRFEDNYERIASYEGTLTEILTWKHLLTAWNVGLCALCAAASALEVGAKVKWFAGEMRAVTLLTARQMEIWAYGQDVFDLYRVPRPDGERLRNVVEFAVRTFGFSFANRGLPIPADRPFLELHSPSGGTWTWNDPASANRIKGAAVDFCLVATQRRNVGDTALRVEGAGAMTWMQIAQCIAGPPSNGPAPGERT